MKEGLPGTLAFVTKQSSRPFAYLRFTPIGHRHLAATRGRPRSPVRTTPRPDHPRCNQIDPLSRKQSTLAGRDAVVDAASIGAQGQRAYGRNGHSRYPLRTTSHDITRARCSAARWQPTGLMRSRRSPAATGA